MLCLNSINSIWCILGLVTVWFGRRWWRNHSQLPLPPGPKPLPLVGNMFDIPTERQWETYGDWSKKFDSDIIHLNVGGRSIVVLSSMEAIRELFEKRFSLYSDRPRLPMIVELMGWDFGIGVMKYGERSHRKLFHEAFNVAAAKEFQPQERAAAHALLRRILNRPSDIMEHFRHMAAGLIMDVTYGINVNSPGDPYIGLAKEAMHGLSIASVPRLFLVDSIPWLKYIPSWFPGAGFQRKAKQWRKVMRELLEAPFAHTKRNMVQGTAIPSFTSSSLAALESSNSQNTGKQEKETLIKATAANMFAAGADTTVAALGSFALAMLANPGVQAKAQAEIDAVLGSEHLPDFADVDMLPYVSAVVKEVQQWRNVTPLAIPHYLAVDDEYRGYRIPAGTTVIGNTWAILHDEEMYPDPHLFKPERFLLDGKLNPAIQDPETATFGFGRRICPGRHMATSSLMITIASILATMNIKKARDKNGEEIEPSHEYFPGLALLPVPFECSITPRSRKAIEVIEATSGSE
ncbi:cytochrome P450 [Mycena rosella]|uniref:Cytochrome P450 n=1 Tax=Mycena rosella TaxID=1033263 RepID=A0AAD7DKW0_MYCRO|nr:cytochrome P450 [Mycena rosella]